MGMIKTIFEIVAGVYTIVCPGGGRPELIDVSGNLSIPVQKLIGALEIKNVQTPKEFLDYSQGHFLRPKDKERWQIKSHEWDDKKDVLFPIFAEFGMTGSRDPTEKHYDYTWILGSTLPSLCRKFEYLERLVERGVDLGKIYCLTGDRDLDPAVDRCAYWGASGRGEKDPTTEGEAASFIWNSVFSKKLPTVQITFVNVAKLLCEDGSTRRPNTRDTIHEWLKIVPNGGSVLSISNNPHLCYQHAVGRAELSLSKWQGALETVGGDLICEVNIFFDALAREFYEEYHQKHGGTGPT
jgi:hypothetical protein